jgi:hypothetical protein
MVTGSEKVRYGIIIPTSEFERFILAKRVNSGMSTQCTGIIMPSRK